MKYSVRRSNDYYEMGWWFVQDNNGNMIYKNSYIDIAKDKYYQTEYAAREAAALLNLQEEIKQRIRAEAKQNG